MIKMAQSFQPGKLMYTMIKSTQSGFGDLIQMVRKLKKKSLKMVNLMELGRGGIAIDQKNIE